MGRREVDAAGCKTVYLSEYDSFAFLIFMVAHGAAVLSFLSEVLDLYCS